MAQNLSLKKKTWWHKTPEIFAACSEASNIGIVINMVSKWAPEIMKIGHGFLGGVSHYADVLIYVFKALIRIIKLIGRYCFQIQFDDEDQTHQKQKMICDALSLASFSLAILSFASVLTSGPVAITLGWTFGLIGLGIILYTDYYLPKKQAELEWQELYQNYLDNNSDNNILELLKKYQNSQNLDYEFKLFAGVIGGLTLLLVFGSAALFAPAGIAAILTIVAKIASIYLATLAVFRFSNFLKSKWMGNPLEKKGINDNFAKYHAEHSNETRAELLLDFTQANKIRFFPPAEKQAKQRPALQNKETMLPEGEHTLLLT